MRVQKCIQRELIGKCWGLNDNAMIMIGLNWGLELMPEGDA